jgi:hypothetical protein
MKQCIKMSCHTHWHNNRLCVEIHSVTKNEKNKNKWMLCECRLTCFIKSVQNWAVDHLFSSPVIHSSDFCRLIHLILYILWNSVNMLMFMLLFILVSHRRGAWREREVSVTCCAHNVLSTTALNFISILFAQNEHCAWVTMKWTLPCIMFLTGEYMLCCPVNVNQSLMSQIKVSTMEWRCQVNWCKQCMTVPLGPCVFNMLDACTH